MFKSFAILTAGILLLALTGCDAGSNSFSKREKSAERQQVAHLSFSDTEVLQ